MLEVALLGQLRVLSDGQPVRTLTPSRVQSLLAYLVLFHDRTTSRSRLAKILWPESTESQARTNLRKWLGELRERFPAANQYLDISGQRVGCRAVAFSLDVEEFESLVAEGSESALRQAVQLYRGDLLEDCSDEWLVPERERLLRLFLHATELLVEHLVARGAYADALSYANLLVSRDSGHEAGYRLLMRLHAAQGEMAAVQRVYKDCADRLREEFDLEPSPATLELYARLCGASSSSVSADRAANSGSYLRAPDVAKAGDRPDAETVASGMESAESRLFVGREHELQQFEQWLVQSPSSLEILDVHGPGGVGKSALLRAFARRARQLGREARIVNCDSILPKASALYRALASCTTATEAVHRLNSAGPMLMFDSFEALGALRRTVEVDLLPQVATTVRVVVAGRYPMSVRWPSDSPWQRVVRPLPLRGFSPAEGREYLRRRGLVDPAVASKMIAGTGGNPLALALAADLILHFGVGDLRRRGAWRLTVRFLVEHLLREVQAKQLRTLLECCAVVRHFDEATIAAICGRRNVSQAFQQICRLSVVHPTEHGLGLHEDVRRVLQADLHWRNPDRFRELRRLARNHYRQRALGATPEEKEWLVSERMFLWEHDLAQTLLFSDDEPDAIWLEPGAASDHEEIMDIWSEWVIHTFGIGTVPDFEREELERILTLPRTRVCVARGDVGQALGFSALVPVGEATVFWLRQSRILAKLFENPAVLQAVQDCDPARHSIWLIHHLAYRPFMHAEAVQAALLRDLMGPLAAGGIYLASVAHPQYKMLLHALGFRHVPESTNACNDPRNPVEGYILDLRDVGFETWIEGLLDRGAGPPS